MKKVMDFVQRFDLLPRYELLLAAASGGMDSMCLLDFLYENGYRVCAAHYNHQLRGQEADMDEDLVRAWCAARRIPLCVGTGDVAAYAGENGLTIEEAARKLRYDFLNSVAGQTGAARIVTAHHANDNAETVLFHLARGTGMAGLAGIAPKNGRLVRPFLCLTREELAAYAKEHHVPYRTDATNADTALTRNFIRAEVLPRLCRVNAQAVEHIGETALRLRQEDVGALHGCVSLDGTLYLSTSGGLRTWKPGQEESTLLVSMDELQAQGIGFDTLIYADGDAPALLDRSGKKLWRWQDGALVCTLDYAGTPMDLPQRRYRAAVMQDGWLFLRAAPPEGTVYEADVYRADPLTGDAQRLPLEGVTELCAWEGGLLAVACDVESDVCRLVSVDPESGAVHTLDERSMQGIEGVACDGNTICAIVDGALSLWNGTGWTALQGYALGHLDYAFAVVGEGYASLGTNDMQYVPFTEAGSLPTLTIRGYISADNIDADFQQACPGVAVSRAADPSLTARQVAEAIAAGDETDLFHVRMDGELVALMRQGGLAPLNESDILLADTEGMLARVADAIFQDGSLYAVPSLVLVTVWEGAEEVPATLEALLEKHAAWTEEAPLVAHAWEGGTWTKDDYANLLLTTLITEAHNAGRAVDFRGESFVRMLTALRDAELPETEGEARLDPDEILSLSGFEDMPISGDWTYEPGTTPPPPSAPDWQLPPALSPDARRTAGANLLVYVLNPNARNPDVAMAYLEYLCGHRALYDEALLKPASASPVLHPQIEEWIAWIIEDQHALDAELGLETDEEALAARTDAIRAAPDSWAVTQGRLEAYREEIAPYVDLRLHPLLAGSQKRDGGVYARMLRAVCDYVEGGAALEDCLTRLENLAASVSAVP